MAKFPTYEEMSKKIAEKALDEFLYNGKSIREWIQIIASEDAISRQAVDTLVDELARAISDERCCMSRGRSTATIMQDILDLPSVRPQESSEIIHGSTYGGVSWSGIHKPQESKWVPVSEPPKELGTYLIQTDGEPYMCQCRWTDVNSFWTDFKTKPHWNIFDLPQYSKVVAWMPLPKPYESQERSE